MVFVVPCKLAVTKLTNNRNVITIATKILFIIVILLLLIIVKKERQNYGVKRDDIKNRNKNLIILPKKSRCRERDVYSRMIHKQL